VGKTTLNNRLLDLMVRYYRVGIGTIDGEKHYSLYPRLYHRIEKRSKHFIDAGELRGSDQEHVVYARNGLREGGAVLKVQVAVLGVIWFTVMTGYEYALIV
jgi:hypothetical protein